MGKANILIHLNVYKDTMPTNSPSLSYTKWTRELQGLSADKPQSVEFALAPGESRTLFEGTRTILSDGTTLYSLLLKEGTTNTYQLKHVSGTAPQFRTPRVINSSATTEVTVSTIGSLATFQATGGTIYSMSSVVVGDDVTIGPVFSSANSGRFKVLTKTADSFTVENSSAVAESSVVLGADFANEIRIYSASGVQVGDKMKIDVPPGTYEITGVQDNLVEIYDSRILPSIPLIPASVENVTIYSSAKKLVYLETDKPVDLVVNGVAESKIEPFIEGTTTLAGVLLKKSTIWSMVVTNNGTDMAMLYFASIE